VTLPVGFSIYCTIKDTTTGQTEAYFKDLTGFSVPAKGETRLHLDDAGHGTETEPGQGDCRSASGNDRTRRQPARTEILDRVSDCVKPGTC